MKTSMCRHTSRRILGFGLLAFLPMAVLACGGGDGPSGLTEAEFQQAREDRMKDWQAAFDEMVSALHLEEPARARLESAFLERDQVMRDWFESPKGRRLFELDAALADEARNKDLRAVRAITAEATPLREEIRSLIKSAEQDLFGVLTPEQRLDWEGYQLSKNFFDVASDIDFTPEQVEALRQATPDFLERAQQAGEPNPPAAAFLEFERWAETQVMDSIQREMYAYAKRENPLRSLR